MKSPTTPPAQAVPTSPPPRVDSVLLLRRHPVIEIVHGKDIYRLRQTKQGKLILTK